MIIIKNDMKGKTIIFTGLDRCGKTSMIEMLTHDLTDKNYNVTTLKFGTYPELKGLPVNKVISGYRKKYIDTLFKPIMDNIENDGVLICDRCHLDELVYGVMYRDYGNKANYVLDLESDFNIDSNTGYVIIIIDSSLKCLERDDNQSHSVDVNKKMEEIKLFKEQVTKTNFKSIVIDIANKTIPAVYNEVKSFLNI